MRWSTVALLAPVLAGCSLIYNPNNLPSPRGEAGIDTPTILQDANPSLLELLDISPASIDEGQGDLGSAPALIVIHGHQMVNANLKVTLTPPTGVTVLVDPITDALASPDGDYIAFTVTARVDVALATDVLLDVTVTQDKGAQYGGGLATVTRSGAVTLHGLTELTALTAALLPKYSKVTLPNVTFPTSANPVAINAVSSITLGTVAADALGASAGPGGFPVGVDRGPGAGGVGVSAVGLGFGGGGGGGGFAVAGTGGSNGGATGGTPGSPSGEDQVLSLATNRASAGGAGGAGLAVLGGNTLPGGSGGGGGGVVVLTAGGDISTGTISAKGGPGVNASGGAIVGGGGGGGGGAGGTVVVRTTAGTLNIGTIHVTGGAPGTPAGGTGSVGRVRWDAPTGTAPMSPDRPAHRGPAFKNPTRVVTTTGQTFTLAGTPGDELDVFVTAPGNMLQAGEHASFNSGGIATIMPPLSAGYNQLCVKLTGGMQSEPVANACIDVAFLP